MNESLTEVERLRLENFALARAFHLERIQCSQHALRNIEHEEKALLETVKSRQTAVAQAFEGLSPGSL